VGETILFMEKAKTNGQRKIAEANKGKKPWNYGIPMNEEQKLNKEFGLGSIKFLSTVTRKNRSY
jgi:NUMOD3 motif